MKSYKLFIIAGFALLIATVILFDAEQTYYMMRWFLAASLLLILIGLLTIDVNGKEDND